VGCLWVGWFVGLRLKACWWKPKRIDELQTHFSFIYSESATQLPSTQDSEQWGGHLHLSICKWQK
jgi:hypothetical protein